LQIRKLFNPNIKALIKSSLIPISFAAAIALLYFLDPKSFEYSWKGRTPYIIFLWLFILELIITRKQPSHAMDFSKWTTKIRISATAVVLASPTIYVIAAFFWGLNSQITELGKLAGTPYKTYGWTLGSWTLSIEYLVFILFLVASIILIYGTRGLKQFPIALFFIGATEAFYMIDTYYPYGTFVALQALVPITGVAVTALLNLIGYRARLFASIERAILWVTPGSSNTPRFIVAIFWPSSGIHSMFIYTFTILLFLKNSAFSLKPEVVQSAVSKRLRLLVGSKQLSPIMRSRVVKDAANSVQGFLISFLRLTPFYIIFVVGALGTFFVNVLRIATICILGLTASPSAADYFHNYVGESYFITWIIVYPLIIIYGRRALTALSKAMQSIATEIHRPKIRSPAEHKTQ